MQAAATRSHLDTNHRALLRLWVRQRLLAVLAPCVAASPAGGNTGKHARHDDTLTQRQGHAAPHVHTTEEGQRVGTVRIALARSTRRVGHELHRLLVQHQRLGAHALERMVGHRLLPRRPRAGDGTHATTSHPPPALQRIGVVACGGVGADTCAGHGATVASRRAALHGSQPTQADGAAFPCPCACGLVRVAELTSRTGLLRIQRTAGG